MLHPAVQVLEQDAIHGRGLVATEWIRRGEVVWKLDPDLPRLSCSEVATWSQQEREALAYVAFQCDEANLAICEDLSRYMNHSCDPNTWWADSDTLIARRDIGPGEEVTYDYATTEVEVDFQMSCRCGAQSCRGIVSHKDYRRPDWQERYGSHLPAHVRRAIERAQRGTDGR
jgi:SET domain-containing protein